MNYFRNAERAPTSETYEPPREGPAPGMWRPPLADWQPPEKLPPSGESIVTRDLYVAIATGLLVIGVIGGGIYIAHRSRRRRRR